jgi:sarcosine oxidase subunit alpha
MVSTKKDFIGAHMARRPVPADPADSELVGLKAADGRARLTSGAHFLPLAGPVDAAHEQGYVTSVAYSPSLGQWIGLGLLRDGRQRHGERLRICDLLRGQEVVVEICDPVFIDREGVRLRG